MMFTPSQFAGYNTVITIQMFKWTIFQPSHAAFVSTPSGGFRSVQTASSRPPLPFPPHSSFSTCKSRDTWWDKTRQRGRDRMLGSNSPLTPRTRLRSRCPREGARGRRCWQLYCRRRNRWMLYKWLVGDYMSSRGRGGV